MGLNKSEHFILRTTLFVSGKISFTSTSSFNKNCVFGIKISNRVVANLRLEDRLRRRHRRLQVADALQDGRRQLRDVGVVPETLNVDAVLVDLAASPLHRVIQSLEILDEVDSFPPDMTKIYDLIH